MSLWAVDSLKLEPQNLLCDPPSKAKGIKSSSTMTTVTLNWKLAQNNAWYTIYCLSHPDGQFGFVHEPSAVAIAGLEPGTAYTFAIVTRNLVGEPAVAAMVTVKTKGAPVATTGNGTGSSGCMVSNLGSGVTGSVNLNSGSGAIISITILNPDSISELNLGSISISGLNGNDLRFSDEIFFLGSITQIESFDWLSFGTAVTVDELLAFTK